MSSRSPWSPCGVRAPTQGCEKCWGTSSGKKAVGLLSPISLVLVLPLNVSADLPFLFALMLGPGLKT